MVEIANAGAGNSKGVIIVECIVIGNTYDARSTGNTSRVRLPQTCFMSAGLLSCRYDYSLLYKEKRADLVIKPSNIARSKI